MSFGIQPYPMLWGLGALGFLALLLIHLWNRKEGRRILVGSIQWLDHLEEKKFSRIKFSEFWRFLLRFALIGLFFLLLLQPFLKRLTKADQFQDT